MDSFSTQSPPASRLFVTPAECLYSPEYLGIPLPLNPKQAASLVLCRGRFPLPTVLIMGRRMVRIADILAFAQGIVTTPPPGPPPRPEPDLNGPLKRKRGRPSNAEVAARRADELGDGVGHD